MHRFVVAFLGSALIFAAGPPSAAGGRERHPATVPGTKVRCDDPRLYNGAPLADYAVPVPGTAPTPYYDHGPDWGTDPRKSKPTYGIDPACDR